MWARLAQGQKKPACFRLAETSCHSPRFPESAGMNRERDSHGLGCSATPPAPAVPQPCPSPVTQGAVSTHQAFPGEGVGVVLCRIVRGGGGGQAAGAGAAGAGCTRSSWKLPRGWYNALSCFGGSWPGPGWACEQKLCEPLAFHRGLPWQKPWHGVALAGAFGHTPPGVPAVMGCGCRAVLGCTVGHSTEPRRCPAALSPGVTLAGPVPWECRSWAPGAFAGQAGAEMVTASTFGSYRGQVWAEHRGFPAPGRLCCRVTQGAARASTEPLR